MKKIFTFLGICAAFAVNAQIVINEAYGGGGNSGATLKHDFIELKNIGTTTVTLTGATLQYASAANPFSSYHTLPTITLDPGQTYLIQEAAGTGGTVTNINPDYVAPAPTPYSGTQGTTPGFAMGGTAFKIALASDATQVTGPTATNVIDFLGAGTTASWYEGSGPAPAPSNTNSVQRSAGDTNDNAADFITGTPTPTNSAGGNVLGIKEIMATKSNYLKNTQVDSDLFFQTKGNASVKVFNINGQLVKTANISSSNAVVNVSNLAKGIYIVTTETADEKVSQKFIKK